MRLTAPRLVLLVVLLMETSYLLMTLKKMQILEEECSYLQENAEFGISKGEKRRGEPTIYVVTPTYKRMTQIADMTRLSQTLMHVSNMHWIVVEDAETTSEVVHELIERTGLPYTHLAAAKPPDTKESKWMGRGVFNRREALRWLREEKAEGILYFADDDNSYDVRIFEQMRATQKVSVWPVGMILGLGISSPIVRNGKIEAFHDGFQWGRKFSVDMAGFAVNLRLLHINPDATIPTRVSYLEDGFLKKLRIDLKDLEPLADGCTQVLVWHTKTRSPATPDLKHVEAQYVDTNLYQLYRNMLR
ncbi:unnamed protein product [Meganyctiphanes norvegica]|uniref:Galactosylgalactosylxylosylprotein 3-beta-glucuronosyltransferase n=1 Tax=Meganyctiphanes norvegica TaxID=48144 RepID=A0AAV2PRB9_MEGNR